ncbi:MAG: glycosyltransferase [Candidatus Saccharimonadales bacterium]
MRIGLFTDTYHPSTNGIVTVVDITRRQLEAAGHDVYVFCPKVRAEDQPDDDHVVYFPSVPTRLFEDARLSVIFPPRVLRTIRKLDLDIIQIFTPMQVGLMGVYAAQRTGAVLVGQHCTDFYQYAEHYPHVLPGMLVLATTLPFTFRFAGVDARTMLAMYRPQFGVVKWNRDVIERVITMLYSRCDMVIALSRKSKRQLEAWCGEYTYDVTLMPTGVDALPAPKKGDVEAFRKTWNIAPDDEVIGYVGRLGSEKNLELLIKAFAYLAPRRENIKLLFVGDFDYRETLEYLAEETGYGERIIFTGKLPRDELGTVYATLDVFLFPSTTDTQGLVIHEAALAGCPLVLVDKELSEVMVDGENGFLANENGLSIARKTIEILDDKERMKRFSQKSKQLAKEFSEKKQVAKQIALYEELLARDRS